MSGHRDDSHVSAQVFNNCSVTPNLLSNECGVTRDVTSHILNDCSVTAQVLNDCSVTAQVLNDCSLQVLNDSRVTAQVLNDCSVTVQHVMPGRHQQQLLRAGQQQSSNSRPQQSILMATPISRQQMNLHNSRHSMTPANSSNSKHSGNNRQHQHSVHQPHHQSIAMTNSHNFNSNNNRQQPVNNSNRSSVASGRHSVVPATSSKSQIMRNTNNFISTNNMINSNHLISNNQCHPVMNHSSRLSLPGTRPTCAAGYNSTANNNCIQAATTLTIDPNTAGKLISLDGKLFTLDNKGLTCLDGSKVMSMDGKLLNLEELASIVAAAGGGDVIGHGDVHNTGVISDDKVMVADVTTQCESPAPAPRLGLRPPPNYAEATKQYKAAHVS